MTFIRHFPLVVAVPAPVFLEFHLDVGGSIRDVFIGWVVGDGLPGKGYTSIWWQGTIEAQKSAWGGCAGSLMPEMKQNQQCGRLGCSKKQQHWI